MFALELLKKHDIDVNKSFYDVNTNCNNSKRRFVYFFNYSITGKGEKYKEFQLHFIHDLFPTKRHLFMSHALRIIQK